jgi:hypothetical protein
MDPVEIMMEMTGFPCFRWKTRRVYSSLLGYNVSRKILLSDLAESQLAAHGSSFAVFTIRSSRYDSRILRFFRGNSLARDVLNCKTFHVIARKQPLEHCYRGIFLSNPD